MNPLNGVGLLFEEQGSRHAYLGTCFAFRHKNHFLTAAHCIAQREVANLAVHHPFDGIYTRVARVEVHPSADIALVILANDGRETTEPFWDYVSNYGLGEEYMAYGFPEDSLGKNEVKPTARLFRGYFQRFMEHKSHMGYTYVAAELSTACPGGLSGGPLFRPGAPVMLTALVAENLEAATLLDSEEVVLSNGQIVHEHYRRVINYGVAVMLDHVGEWINQHVPPRKT